MALKRFYSAVDKLMNAFLIGKVTHGDMCSCAVGTLCGGDDSWHHLRFCGSKIGIDKTDKTGYSPVEIFEIEKYFECRDISAYQNGGWGEALLNNENDVDGFKGLCNVFDYLTSIEDWSDEEQQVNLVEMCLQNN